MGSLVVRCFCQKYDQDIDGLIVCGSPSDNPLAPIGTKIARIYSKVKDDHYRPQLIQNLSFQAFNKRFHTDIPNSWICSDEKILITKILYVILPLPQMALNLSLIL